MVARLAHTLHLPWEFTQQQRACLSANAPKFPAPVGTMLQTLLNVLFKCSETGVQS